MTLSLLLRLPRLFSARHWRRALAVPGLVWAVVLGAGAVAWAPSAIAQAIVQAVVPAATAATAGNKAAQPVRPAALKGVTESGKPVDLASLRGKVVMVVAWSTRCAVCLDNMPELRRNLAGWQGQAFELITVNTDATPGALADWHSLRSQTQPAHLQWPSLWAGAITFSSTLDMQGQLPAVWVLDKTGAVRYQVKGRMPAEAWDQVAELL